MNLLSRNTLLFFAAIIILACLVFEITLDDVKQWVGIDQTQDQIASLETKNSSAPQQADGIAISTIAAQLTIAELRQILSSLPVDNQKELLSNPESFSLFVQQQLAQKSILRLLKADAIEDKPAVQFLMQKSAEKALLEWYLNQLIQRNLAADYPSEQQMKEYYDANTESFKIGQRVYFWQIFLPILPSASPTDIQTLETQARAIRQDILEDKLSFADAALKYSKNSPSRENGGYVGLVKFAELPDSIKEKTIALAENEISIPVKTDDGFHLIKRGAFVDEQSVELDQIRNNLREVMRKQAVDEVRRSLVTEAQKQHPSNTTEQDIEEWRLKLRSGL